MTAAYKKRAKGGWCDGKSNKEASNRGERNYDDKEIEEQLSDESKIHKVVKKSYPEKDITRMLSSLRRVYKFTQRHCNGDIEKLKAQKTNNEWVKDVYNSYYQEYLQLIPEVTKLLERDDIPTKVRRQVVEVLELFKK